MSLQCISAKEVLAFAPSEPGSWCRFGLSCAASFQPPLLACDTKRLSYLRIGTADKADFLFACMDGFTVIQFRLFGEHDLVHMGSGYTEVTADSVALQEETIFPS